MSTAISNFQVHQLSKDGFSTKTSENYNKVRPSYKAEVLSHIRKAVPSQDVKIVELGSGTGIFTRAMLSHPEWASSIGEIKAVEPSEGMRTVFAREVTDPRVSVSEGTFDKTGVAEAWADLIVIAQAYHWCLDHDAAMLEFSRVLKPTGVVVLVWNNSEPEKVAWAQQLSEFIMSYREKDSSSVTGKWREAFETQVYKDHFAPPEEKLFHYSAAATLNSVVEISMSISSMTVLPADEKVKAREKIIEIVERGDGKVWVNEQEGLFEDYYFANVVIIHRK